MIYFCVPTHNEEKTVGVVLWKLRHVMAELPRDYRILVGDDASTDSCAQVLDPYRRVLPLVMMRNTTRRGYAATVEMLLRQAVRMSRYPKRDSVVILQADFTDDLDAAADLVRRLESGADIAVGGPVADAVRPGFLERLATGYARRALARFEWPENADPLNCLSAYRLICVKRALDETEGRRLLAWEGKAANAALLKATLPHARRVECVEMSRHAERAQRGRRFRPLELVMNIRRFAAGTPTAGMVPVDRLGPDEAKGDLSVLHGPAANGAPAERADSSERRTGRDRDAQKRRSGTTSRSAEGGRPRRKTTAESAAGEKPAGRRKKKEDGESRPRRTRTRPADAADAPADTPAPEDAAAAPDVAVSPEAAADGGQSEENTEARPKRRSRGGQRRRGGRNRRRGPKTGSGVSAGEDSGEPNSDAPTGSADGGDGDTGAGDGGSDSSQDVAGQEDASGARKRRRRGRRGGKGRRGGRQKNGTNDAPQGVEQSQAPSSAEGSST